MAKSMGLGRGFDALIPQDFDAHFVADDQARIKHVLITDVFPNPQQPRRTFDEASLRELAGSIKEHGVLQPLIVVSEDGRYKLVAGERRWRASQQAGLNEIPVIVRSLKELEQLEISLIENVQRVDLSPLEQAMSIVRLHQQFSMDMETIASRLGKAVTTLHNVVRLLGLPEAAQGALESGKITEGHARAILAVKDPAAQQTLLDNIIKYGWTVRQAEQFATASKKGETTDKATTKTSTETPETKQLSKHLGVPVRVSRMAKGGRLEIRFTSDAELAKIVRTLTK